MKISDLAGEIAAGAERLKRMAAAIAGIDRRIDKLEGERRAARPDDQFLLSAEIRDLRQQRLEGDALLEEAQRQYRLRRDAYEQAVADATANQHSIGSDCEAAARRFDRALGEAVAALAELELAARPLERTLLPGDLRHYTGWRSIMESVRAAFRERLPAGEAVRDRATMQAHVARMMRTARENASRIKAAQQQKKEAA